jgi:serine/threonine protein kinase/tetratricopeptide (TPR) repeat protein
MIPQRISHYKILKKLGSGGMGEVYLAEDTNLGRTVAIKILPDDVASDPSRHRRFVHEAKASSALKHPGVAGIHELGESDGIHFIVMEHVEGETLETCIKGEPLAIPQILYYAVQIADALEEAHSKGVIHRDIKPANIMITQKDQVKILDFGLAKMLTPSVPEAQLSKVGTQSGTEPGLVLGTVQYMSPEQALGKTVDHRSDLFSFGIVLYQMTTGRLPFAANSTTETINRIVNNAPDAVARYNYACPGELEHIIRKCLEKDPGSRYQSAQDLLIDLKNLKRDTESQPTRISAQPQRRSPNWIWMLLVAAALLVAGAVFFLKRTGVAKKPAEPASETTRKLIAVLPFENLGSAEDQYFAQGMTDEITSRLATVGDLGVISRSSAMQYQKTTKSTKQIGKELGVDYLLGGTIRWSRSVDANRVRVTPQLVRVSDDTQVWSNIYDHVIDDVFQVQSQVAQNVIQQMGITLSESKRKDLAEAPTTNLQAYQIFLHAYEDQNAPGYDFEKLQAAIENYEKAIALDHSFALAYAYLGFCHLQMYHEGVDASKERLSSAKRAIDIALQLKPDLPKARWSLGFYHYYGFRDYEKALVEFTKAAKGAPNDAEIVAASAFVERRQGKFEDSIEHFKQVIALDPRTPDRFMEVGSILMRLRRYREADEYHDRAIQLSPDAVYFYQLKHHNIILWKGDLKASREIVMRMPQLEPNYYFFNWVRQETFERNYDRALHLLDKTTVDVFQEEGRYIPLSLSRAMVLHFSNQKEPARQQFEIARAFLEKMVPQRLKDAAVHHSLGLAYAGLGRKQEAIREAKLAMELLPVSKDAFMGPNITLGAAEIYAMAGEQEQALDQIEYLFSIPSEVSVHWLQSDPVWDPIRKHPRYEQLLRKYVSAE